MYLLFVQAHRWTWCLKRSLEQVPKNIILWIRWPKNRHKAEERKMKDWVTGKKSQVLCCITHKDLFAPFRYLKLPSKIQHSIGGKGQWVTAVFESVRCQRQVTVECITWLRKAIQNSSEQTKCCFLHFDTISGQWEQILQSKIKIKKIEVSLESQLNTTSLSVKCHTKIYYLNTIQRCSTVCIQSHRLHQSIPRILLYTRLLRYPLNLVILRIILQRKSTLHGECCISDKHSEDWILSTPPFRIISFTLQER